MYRFPLFWLFLLALPVVSPCQELQWIGDTLENQIQYHLENRIDCPVFVQIKRSDSLAATISTKEKFLIPPQGVEKKVITFPYAGPSDSTSAKALNQVNVNGVLGDPSDEEWDKDYSYQLPFSKGKKYKIIQGFNSRFTHNKPSSRYAVDFDIPIGDTICAARPGTIVLVRERFTEGGNDRSLYGKANKVIIYHDDGTFAAYMHLDHQGVLVENGDRVQLGQPIGLSGHTGFSTQPHLHLVIHRASEEGSLSVPFHFKNVKKIKKGRKVKRKR